MNANDRSLAAFAMLAHATFHTYELVIPVFVVAWLAEFPVTEAQLGLVLTAGFALVGLLSPVSGVLSDTTGSRTLVTASVVGMGGGFLVIGASPSLPVLALALVVWGSAASLYHPAALSLISRGAERRGEVLANHGAAGNVGTALGPFLAVVLLAFLDWRAVATVLALPAVLVVAIGTRLRFDEAARTDVASDGGITSLREWVDQSRGLVTTAFVLVIVLHGLYGIYYRGVFSFLPNVLAGLPAFAPVDLFGRRVEPAQYAYSGLLTVGIVGQYLGGRLTDRGVTRTGLVGMYAVLALVTVSFVPAIGSGLVPLLVACGGIVFFLYASVPMLQALVADTVPADRHGLTFGYTYLVVFGVGALGAWIAGTALTYAGPGVLFGVLAAFAASGCGVAGVIALRSRASA